MKTRSVRKRERADRDETIKRQHGHATARFPIQIILYHIFPFAFDTLPQALIVAQTCAIAYHWFKTEKRFWEPFLTMVMHKRFSQMDPVFGAMLRKGYQMWPEAMFNVGGVLGVVKSKFIFSHANVVNDDKEIMDDIIQCILYKEKPGYYCLSSYSKYFQSYQERIPYNDPSYNGGVVMTKLKSNLYGPESWITYELRLNRVSGKHELRTWTPNLFTSMKRTING